MLKSYTRNLSLRMMDVAKTGHTAIIATVYIWSEPSNDGSRPESVVLFLQTDARRALASTYSTVIGGR